MVGVLTLPSTVPFMVAALETLPLPLTPLHRPRPRRCQSCLPTLPSLQCNSSTYAAFTLHRSLVQSMTTTD